MPLFLIILGSALFIVALHLQHCQTHAVVKTAERIIKTGGM